MTAAIDIGVRGTWKTTLFVHDNGNIDEMRENLSGPHAGGVVTHRVDMGHIKRFHPDRVKEVFASMKNLKDRQNSNESHVFYSKDS